MTDDELFNMFFERVGQVAYERFSLTIEVPPGGKYLIQWCGGQHEFEFDLEVARYPDGYGALVSRAIDQIEASQRPQAEE